MKHLFIFVIFSLSSLWISANNQPDSVSTELVTSSYSHIEDKLKDLENKLITVLEKEEEIIEDTGILGISLDVFATIVITLLVFGLGQAFLLWQGKDARKDETDDFKNMLFAWIEESKPDIERRIASLQSFSNALHNSTSTGTITYSNYMIPIDRLGIIPLEKYMTSFLSNSEPLNKDKDYRNKYTHNLIYSIDYLIKLDAKIGKAEEQYYTESQSVNNRFDLALQDMYHSITTMSKGDIQAADVVAVANHEQAVDMKMMQLYLDFDGKVKEDPSNINKQLFESLIPDMKKLLPLCKDNYRLAFRIMKVVDDFEKLENDWNILKNNYSKQFATFAHDSQHSLVMLDKCSLYLRDEIRTKVGMW